MRRRLAALATLALVVAAVGPVPTEAASTWTARTTWTGSLGSVVSASLGVGSPDRLSVRAKSLKSGATYSITLRRGTCARSGALVLSRRMTATRLGTLSDTYSLTSAQTRLATLPLAVRVGSRCASLLAPLGVATAPVGSVSSTVLAGGGTAQIASGATVAFPPGALASDATVSITALSPSTTPGQGSPAAWPSQPVGDLYRIDASTASFGAPVTLTLPVPASVPTGGLVLAYFNPATGAWLPVPSTVDGTAHTVSAQVDHLSTWGIFDLSSWLVALGGLASGDLHSFLQGTSDFLTPCQPGMGPWHIDNTQANNAVEGCAKNQTDQSLSLVVRNLRLYPLEIYNSGYLNKTVIDAGEMTPPLNLSRTDVPPATILASMTQATMYTAVAMSILDEISLVAPLGDSIGVETVAVAGHKVPLSVISDLASTLEGVVDLGPIWSDLQAGNFAQAGSNFTALVDNDTVLTALALALNKIAIATGWYAVSDLGADAMKVALVALAPLLAGKVIVEMLTMDADYFFSAQNSVSVAWGRVAPTPSPVATGGASSGVVMLVSTQEVPSPSYQTPAFEMDTGQTFFDGNGGWGDFYFQADPRDGGPKFWANNVGEQGVRDISTGGPFTRYGVPVLLGDEYGILTDPGHVGILRVTSVTSTSVTLVYAYATTPTLSSGSNGLEVQSVAWPNPWEAWIALAYSYTGEPPATRTDGVLATCFGESLTDQRFGDNPGEINPPGIGLVLIHLIVVTKFANPSASFTPFSTASLYCEMYQDPYSASFYEVSLPYTMSWSP